MYSKVIQVAPVQIIMSHLWSLHSRFRLNTQHWMAIGAIFFVGIPATAGPPSLSKEEKWIVSQLNQTGTADLLKLPKKSYPQGKHHAGLVPVHMGFLNRLLLGKYGAPRYIGCWIEHAQFLEEWHGEFLNLETAIWFVHCSFDEPINLTQARFKYSLNFEDCTFNQLVTINQTEVGKGLNFKDCLFKARADLSSCRLAGYLTVENCAFSTDQGPERPTLDLNNTRIDGSLSLGSEDDNRRTKIDGWSDLSYMKVTDKVDMPKLICSGYLLLDGLQVDGPLNCRGCQASRLRAQTLQATALDLSDATLFGPNLPAEDRLDLSSARITSSVKLDRLKLGGEKAAVNLDRLRCGTLSLSGWPPESRSKSLRDSQIISLAGARFETVLASREGYGRRVKSDLASENSNWQETVDFFHDRVIYRSDVYKELERVIEEAGRTNLADQVYVYHRQKDGSQLTGFTGWLDGIQRYFFSYGTNYRRLWIAFVIVYILALIYSFIAGPTVKTSVAVKGSADPKAEQPECTFTVAAKFFYSFWAALDLIYPLSSLGSDKFYQARATSSWRFVFTFCFVFAGLVLASLAVATIPAALQRR